MLQLLMLTVVIFLFLLGALFARNAFRPGSSGEPVYEVIASSIIFSWAAALWALAIYIIDNTLHWWL